MIILDNSVLSAFRRLKLLSKLKKLIFYALISKEVFNEYFNFRKKFQTGLKSRNQIVKYF
jgi:hypothetical protein